MHALANLDCSRDAFGIPSLRPPTCQIEVRACQLPRLTRPLLPLTTPATSSSLAFASANECARRSWECSPVRWNRNSCYRDCKAQLPVRLSEQALPRLGWLAMSFQFDFDSGHQTFALPLHGPRHRRGTQGLLPAADQIRLLRPDAAAGLTDFTAADSVEVSPKTIRQLASLPPLLTEISRVRCIVAPTDKVFGLARMFELQGGYTRSNLHVVRTIKEALAVLGVPEPKFEPLEPSRLTIRMKTMQFRIDRLALTRYSCDISCDIS